VKEQESALQRELHQSRPFRSRGQEATLGLWRTADLLRRRFSQVLEPHGVTLQQYNVLRILRGAGERGLPTLTIAERMIEQTPGITRLLDRLEAHGWVARERCPSDRRQVLCRLSPTGDRLLAELDAPIAQVDDDCLAMLSGEELERLIALLDRIRAENRPEPSAD
jgi:DNA-binding MarR family transcriptional regulator